MSNWILNGARRIRQSMLVGLRAGNLFRRAAASSWRGRQLLILCYHGVSLCDEHEWRSELFVTTSFLRRRFEILTKHGYVVLPLGDAVRSLRAGTLPPRSVVLTFDDGFYNFIAAAVPLLEEFGFPATNYVSSYHCINQRPLLELTLRYMLWRARGHTLPPNTFPNQDVAVDLRSSQQRDAWSEKLLHEGEKLANDRVAQLAWTGNVAKQLGVDWDQFLSSRILHLLNPDEVAEVSARGFDIQLHTHRHRTPRDKETFCAEVLENRRILEECTGRPTVHFCYPRGDVDPAFLPWLRDLGVETATTGVSRLARASDSPLLLPRYVDTMAQPDVVFESWLCGVADLMNAYRR